MTTKEYLGQIARLERKIRIQKSDIAMLRELSYSPSIKMDSERVQTSSDYDPMASAVAKIDEEEIKLSAMIEKYIAVRDKIKQQILNMNDQLYSDILYDKYVVGESFEKMRPIFGYSKRHLIRCHGYALLEFEKQFSDSYCNFTLF